jgi:hypothetical protein
MQSTSNLMVAVLTLTVVCEATYASCVRQHLLITISQCPYAGLGIDISCQASTLHSLHNEGRVA